MTPLELKDSIVEILEEKKAIDITVLPVAEMTILADFFIICTGRSNTQIKAIAENVMDAMEKKGIDVLREDGTKEGKWVVLDYGSVILHIFNDETRVFYCLEKLWSERKPMKEADPEE